MKMLLLMTLMNYNVILFKNSVLNQDMVFNINSNEWLRLQFSDNTVRVPNTKSFLSQ